MRRPIFIAGPKSLVWGKPVSPSSAEDHLLKAGRQRQRDPHGAPQARYRGVSPARPRPMKSSEELVHGRKQLVWHLEDFWSVGDVNCGMRLFPTGSPTLASSGSPFDLCCPHSVVSDLFGNAQSPMEQQDPHHRLSILHTTHQQRISTLR